MSWLHEHAAELSALGAIFMNLATMVIIYFNVNQLKLNSRSLNVDINFKVFELRKNLYKRTLTFISSLSHDKGLRQHLLEIDDNQYSTSELLNQLRESIDNYKYLFSLGFSQQLEKLLLDIENGIALERRIIELKNKDASLWAIEDQNEMHALAHNLKGITSCIMAFEVDNFLPYLNISNFDKDLMRSANVKAKNRITDFSTTISFVKKLRF